MTYDRDPHPQLLMPELQQALAQAVRAERPQGAIQRRRRLRTGGLALAAVLCSGTAAVAATSGWNPFGGDNPDPPTVATAAVPGEQTAALGVLRRAQTDADRSPEVSAAINRLRARNVGGVHTDGVRVLSTSGEGVTFLVPVTRQVTDGTPDVVREDVICLATATPAHTVAGREVGAGTTYRCGDLADIRAGKLVSGAQWGGRLELTGIAPDGAAAVRIPMRGGPSITAKIADNGFRVEATDAAGSLDREGLRWLDAQGNPLPSAP
ncbi:hypothetical protein [Baekduia sp. Peel2402]|uniref:hypothetical protein n=1 Tax=Baekduia sp. Peel2402 TaxID=3458296 RepID=UPI00403E80FB